MEAGSSHQVAVTRVFRLVTDTVLFISVAPTMKILIIVKEQGNIKTTKYFHAHSQHFFRGTRPLGYISPLLSSHPLHAEEC